jgi:hypothetical protein
LDPTAPDEVRGDSNQSGKYEGQSNLALFQLRLPLRTELRVLMLLGCVVVGPANAASKTSRLLFIVPDNCVECMLGQNGNGDPVHYDLSGLGRSEARNATLPSTFAFDWH